MKKIMGMQDQPPPKCEIERYVVVDLDLQDSSAKARGHNRRGICEEIFDIWHPYRSAVKLPRKKWHAEPHMEIRIAKFNRVTSPCYLVNFSVFDAASKRGTMLEACVPEDDAVAGSDDAEIVGLAWEQVKAQALAFEAQQHANLNASPLVGTVFTPPPP
jgi:hypothetical protein